MRKFSAIFYETFLEIKNSKMLYVYGIITVFNLLIFGLLPSVKIQGENIFESGMISPEMIVEGIGYLFQNYIGFIIFLMVFGSAWLVPSFQSKGRIELTLSKPLSRINIAGMKFISVFVIKSIIMIIIVSLLWFVISIRINQFVWGFFLGLYLALLQFLIVYAIVFFFGISSRSGALTIVGYFVLRIGADLLASRELVYQFIGESFWTDLIDVIYHILPKIGEMNNNYRHLIAGEGFIETYTTWSSLGFAAVLFLLSLLIFHRKDY